MLEEAYVKPDTVTTKEIYQEMSMRTGLEQKELKKVFAVFYDVVSEKIIDGKDKNLFFDWALGFHVKLIPEKVSKNSNGELVVVPEKMTVKVKLGNKIKLRIIDLYNEMKKFP